MAKQNAPEEQNPDEIPVKKVPQPKKNPDDSSADFEGVKFAYAELGKAIIKQANQFLKLFDHTFGEHNPRLISIDRMYEELMKGHKPEDYIPILEDFKRRTAHSLDDLLKAKFVYETNAHKNQKNFDIEGISGKSDVETAKTSWQYAVLNYEEERQNAEATLIESVYASRKAHKDMYHPNDDLESKIAYNVDYLSEATEVASALESYGKTMNASTEKLSKAFSNLLEAFNKSWNAFAQRELDLISSNRNDSKTLWSSIQSYYKKKFGNN